MLKRLLVLHLLFQTSVLSLFAKEPFARIPLCEVVGEPSAMVAGCVNVITGAYCIHNVDFVLPSPLPLSMETSYCSSAHSSNTFFGKGWRHNHPREITLGTQDWVYSVIEEQPSGASLLHLSGRGLEWYGEYTKIPNHHTTFDKHNWVYEDGLINTSQGDISGRTNLQNQLVEYDHDQGSLVVHLCNGGKRLYQPTPNYGITPVKLRLSRELHPNGNRRFFHYRGQGNWLDKLGTSNATETEVFAWIRFGEIPNNHWTTGQVATASDGRQAVYYYTPRIPPDAKQYKHYISTIVRPNAPVQTYDYGATHGMSGLRIIRQELPENHFQQIFYYGIGPNQVGNTLVNVKIHEKGDVRGGRVCLLQSPVGVDSTPVLTHRFFYHHELIPGSYPEYSTGYTDVRDAHNHRTLYRFVLGDRLTHIERYLGSADDSYSLYSTERIFWGSPNRSQHGDLISRALLEADSIVRSCWHLEYDSKHNVIAEYILGNLSGQNTIPPELNSSGIPLDNPCERYCIHRTYSNDRLNLKLTESLPNGRLTQFRYKAGTDLLEATLVSDGQKIVKREFREYDDNAVVTKIIIDDGSGTTSDDLTEVLCRRITYMTPRATTPCLGLPEVVAEYYLDLALGQERLLNRKVNAYSIEGWITHQDHYDANDELRYSLHWVYDFMGNVLFEQNALGQIIERRYDANGNKIYEKGPSQDYHTEYVYDYSNRLIAEERVCIDGQRFKQAHRYDYLSNRIASTDIYGNVTTYVYDELNRVIAIKPPSCAGNEGTISQQYDIAGNVTEIRDPLGNITRKSYTIRGQPYLIEYPDGTTEKYLYNLDGTVQCHTLPDGTTTALVYDALGNVLRKETYSVVTSATYQCERVLSETDGRGNVTRYEYDGAGRHILLEKGTSKTRIIYDSLGRPYKTIELIGNATDAARVTIKEYDLLDRVIEERLEDMQGQVFKRIQTTYDSAGHPCETIEFTQNGPAKTQLVYNAQGNISERLDAQGNVTHIHYDYAHLNTDGQHVLQVTTTDPLGNTKQETYDTRHRLVKVEKRGPFGQTTALRQLTYDPVGNKIRQLETVITAGSTPRDYLIRWEYDSIGRVTHTTESGGDVTKTTLQLYNAFGRLSTIAKPDGVCLQHSYDQLGRLCALTSTDGTVDYRYAYDSNNNLTNSEDLISEQHTSREYDPFNRPTRDKLGTGPSLWYQYDDLGRITKLTLPDQSCIQYSYDAAYLREVARDNPDGTPQYQHLYTAYDLRGCQLSSQLIGQAGFCEREWDSLGRNITIASSHFTERTQYDTAGNLLYASIQDMAGQFANTYTYNDLYQLTSESGSRDCTYTYDSIDNRLSKNGAAYAISPLNQVTSDSRIQYAYDPNGNLLSKTEGSQQTRFAYDALNRLIRVELPDATTFHYTYDSFNRRLTKTSSQGRSETYLYQGLQEVGVIAGDTITQLRILGLGKGADLGATIAIELDGSCYAPIHDHRGNICCLLDNKTGNPVMNRRYSAFGEIIETHSVIACPWGFASKRLDPETGLLLFAKRYYDPQLGRWITPDPVGFADGPNLYAYVHNSPLTCVDPYGLQTHCPHCGRPLDNASSSIWSKVRETNSKCWQTVAQIGHNFLPSREMQKKSMSFWSTCGNFDPPAGYLDHSRVSVIPRTGENKNVVVQFNGICTDDPYCQARGEKVSQSLGGCAVVISYGADKGLVRDLSECFLNILGFQTHSQRVGEQALLTAISIAKEHDGCIIPITHSRGGLTFSGSYQNVDPAALKMIYPVTNGSAKVIDDEQFGGTTNNCHVGDSIPPLADPVTYWKSVLQGDQSPITFIGNFGDANPGTAHGFEEYYFDKSVEDARRWMNKHEERGLHW